MTERIGLKAQFGLGQFNRGVSQYNSAINKMNRNTSSVSGSISSALGSIGSAIGGVATVAGGIIAANVFGKLASGIQNFVSSGLDAVSNAQMLEASLGSLLTANNMYEKSTTTTTVAIQKSSAEMAKNAQAVKDLTLKRNTLSAKIQEQKERIRQMTEEWTSEGLATQTAKSRLAEMENQLEKTNTKISNLSGSQTEYADVTKTTFEQVMNMTEAQGLAAKQSQKLLREIDRIAIVSPFEQEQVQQVAKYAVAAGLGVKETSAFTASFLDMAAAVGIGSQELDFAADQLLQVKKIGKLTTIDLRQLRRLGIDLEKIIGVEMGMSIEEFNAEAEKTPKVFDDLFQAVTDFSANTFAGTTEKMATSIEGLKSTFGDIFRIGARNILRPLVDAVSPTISEMLNKMADFFSGPRATAIGKKLTSTLMNSIRTLRAIGVFDFIQNSFSKLISLGSRVSEIIGKISSAFQKFGVRGASISILGMLGFDSSQISSILNFADTVKSTIDKIFDKISGAFQKFGIRGASISILGMLGFDPSQIGSILSFTDSISDTIDELTTIFNDLFSGTTFGKISAIRNLSELFGIDISDSSTLLNSIMGISNSISEIFDTISDLSNSFESGGITQVFTDLFGSLSTEAPSILSDLGDIISTTLSEMWTSTIQPTLAEWGDKFMGWVAVAYTNIPSTLTSIIEKITSFLGESWPVVDEALLEWSDMFWDWVVEAAKGAGTALAGLAIAITAWSSSGEGQKAMTDAGQVLGAHLIDSLKILLSSAEGMGEVLIALLGSLTTAALAILPGLANIGVSLVSGIISGMLKKIGLVGEDFQPTLISELANVYSGAADNALTALEIVGNNIIIGILNGINSGIKDIRGSITGIADNIVTIFKSVLGISSPSTVFMEFGINLIDGLIIGIQNSAGRIGEVLSSLFSGDILSSIIPEGGLNNLLGGLLGGGGMGTQSQTDKQPQPGEEGGSGPFASMLASIQQLLPIIQQAQQQVTIFATTIQSGLTTMVASATESLSTLSEMLQSTFGDQLIETATATATSMQSSSVQIVAVLQEMQNSLLMLSSEWANVWQSIASSTSSMSSQVIGITRNMHSQIVNILSLENFYKIGVFIIKGIVKGIKENEDKVREALLDVIKKAMSAIKKELGISSPSKAGISIGQQIVTGLIIGAKQLTGQLTGEFENVGKSAIAAFDKVINTVPNIIPDSTLGDQDKARTFAEGKRFRGGLKEMIIKQLESGAGLGAKQFMDIFNKALNKGGKFGGSAAFGAYGMGIFENSREIAKQVFDSISDDVKKVLTRINNDIGLKLAQGASQFLQLGNSAIKNFIDPLKNAIDEIDNTKIALPAATGSKNFLKQLNELQTLKARQGFGEILSTSELDKMEKLQSAINSIEGGQEIADMNKELNQLTAKSEMLRSVGGKLSTDEQSRLKFLQEELKTRTTSAAIGGGEVTTIGKILDEIDSLTEKRKLLKNIGAGLSIEDQQQLNLLKQQVSQNDILRKAQENRLANQEKIAKVEKQQAKLQEQQAKLQFLTGQLNLLKTIDELGLNSKEILKGIQLGLGTDQKGLIDAMGRVVDTIIGTVDDQLQIASPSKLMIDRGKQIIMGLSEGMRTAANQLNRQIQVPILSTAQNELTVPVNGRSVNNTTTVNNDNRQQKFNMPISVSGDQTNTKQLRNFILRTVSQGA